MSFKKIISSRNKYGFSFNLLLYGKNIPEDIKERCYENLLETPQWAYFLRKGVKDLPEDIKRKAEEKCCEDPEWAYYLRINVKDLP